MTKDELIVKQQLEIEEFKQKQAVNKQLIDEIRGRFVNVGAPLNDNVLQFNKDQINWGMKTLELIEHLEI